MAVALSAWSSEEKVYLSHFFQDLGSRVRFGKVEKETQRYYYYAHISGGRLDLFGLVYSVCVSGVYVFLKATFRFTPCPSAAEDSPGRDLL